MAIRFIGPLLLLLSLGIPAVLAGQQAAPCLPLTGGSAGGGAADSMGLRPDIMIRASVQADEVRFGSQPEVDVRLDGCAVLDSVRVVERRNLPRPVQPGVTYRDVFVAVEILGHLNARCLLAGLLGADSVAGPGAAIGACPGAATPRPVVAPNDR